MVFCPRVTNGDGKDRGSGAALHPKNDSTEGRKQAQRVRAEKRQKMHKAMISHYAATPCGRRFRNSTKATHPAPSGRRRCRLPLARWGLGVSLLIPAEHMQAAGPPDPPEQPTTAVTKQPRRKPCLIRAMDKPALRMDIWTSRACPHDHAAALTCPQQPVAF